MFQDKPFDVPFHGTTEGILVQPPVTVTSSETKLVLILSYQRTGSSFLGDVLFSSNPDVFYVYEPLDPLYSAMFGVSQGWTVPSDITTHLDGSLRYMTLSLSQKSGNLGALSKIPPEYGLFLRHSKWMLQLIQDF